MLIVGELINSSRQAIAAAIEGRDRAYLQDLARRQVEAGANVIDVNCGTKFGTEAAVMTWLVDALQEVVDVPLCIDSPSPQVLEAGLSPCRDKALVNSISAERERMQEVLPLLTKYKASVVALCMDDGGMPKSVPDRLRIAEKLVPELVAAGVPEEDIYLDPLIKPLAVDNSHGSEALESIRALREKYPRVHLICGLSNISFGLPRRPLLNRAFALMCFALGMDAFILDPLDRHLMSLLTAAGALAGRDEFCLEYIAAERSGKLLS
ncbi:MAG TPA: methyltetrahydrofolate cobalamin methyltransferase [Spirochaetia bacterium]|nr:methyltetrahydrofolate cobalamin methyltransferase [Spirochaetia bacterium]